MRVRWDTWLSLANRGTGESGNFFRVGVQLDNGLKLWRRVWEGYRP